MEKRILIVGTVPYNRHSTSRALEAYFSGWDRSCLAQIFSNTKKPTQGHCQSLYQITDKQMLLKWLGSKQEVGVLFHYDQLSQAWTDNDLEVGGGIIEKLYHIGSKKSPLIYLLRGLLWRKDFWCTDKLNAWLDDFAPECVFLAFSDDFFIPTIALYAARRFQIPIVSCIGDDYCFNRRFSLSPLYYIYRHCYKGLIDAVFAHRGSAVYISDKIRDKYNREFSLAGKTVYLTSEMRRRPFRPIDPRSPKVVYFGNIGLGRYRSLIHIARALGSIDPGYRLDVYSNQVDPKASRAFSRCRQLRFHGAIAYSQVVAEVASSDLFVIVEGFRPGDINATRYSLSTKAADGLASGVQIFVYGPLEAGVVEYMAGTGAACVCTDPKTLRQRLRTILYQTELQRACYDRAAAITERNHSLSASRAVFRSVVEEVTNDHDPV